MQAQLILYWSIDDNFMPSHFPLFFRPDKIFLETISYFPLVYWMPPSPPSSRPSPMGIVPKFHALSHLFFRPDKIFLETI